MPKRKQKRKKFYRKTGNKRGKFTEQKGSPQRGGFLSKYDFA